VHFVGLFLAPTCFGSITIIRERIIWVC